MIRSHSLPPPGNLESIWISSFRVSRPVPAVLMAKAVLPSGYLIFSTCGETPFSSPFPLASITFFQVCVSFFRQPPLRPPLCLESEGSFSLVVPFNLRFLRPAREPYFLSLPQTAGPRSRYSRLWADVHKNTLFRSFVLPLANGARFFRIRPSPSPIHYNSLARILTTPPRGTSSGVSTRSPVPNEGLFSTFPELKVK